MTTKERIILALERAGKSQRDLAKVLGKSSPTVSEMLSKPGELDSVSYIEAASQLTGYPFEALRTGRGFEDLERDPETAATRDLVLNEPLAAYQQMNDRELKIVVELLYKTLAAKDQTIRLLEKRVNELEAQMSTKAKNV